MTKGIKLCDPVITRKPNQKTLINSGTDKGSFESTKVPFDNNQQGLGTNNNASGLGKDYYDPHQDYVDQTIEELIADQFTDDPYNKVSNSSHASLYVDKYIYNPLSKKQRNLIVPGSGQQLRQPFDFSDIAAPLFEIFKAINPAFAYVCTISTTIAKETGSLSASPKGNYKSSSTKDGNDNVHTLPRIKETKDEFTIEMPEGIKIGKFTNHKNRLLIKEPDRQGLFLALAAYFVNKFGKGIETINTRTFLNKTRSITIIQGAERISVKLITLLNKYGEARNITTLRNIVEVLKEDLKTFVLTVDDMPKIEEFLPSKADTESSARSKILEDINKASAAINSLRNKATMLENSLDTKDDEISTLKKEVENLAGLEKKTLTLESKIEKIKTLAVKAYNGGFRSVLKALEPFGDNSDPVVWQKEGLKILLKIIELAVPTSADSAHVTAESAKKHPKKTASTPKKVKTSTTGDDIEPKKDTIIYGESKKTPNLSSRWATHELIIEVMKGLNLTDLSDEVHASVSGLIRDLLEEILDQYLATITEHIKDNTHFNPKRILVAIARNKFSQFAQYLTSEKTISASYKETEFVKLIIKRMSTFAAENLTDPYQIETITMETGKLYKTLHGQLDGIDESLEKYKQTLKALSIIKDFNDKYDIIISVINKAGIEPNARKILIKDFTVLKASFNELQKTLNNTPVKKALTNLVGMVNAFRQNSKRAAKGLEIISITDEKNENFHRP